LIISDLSVIMSVKSEKGGYTVAMIVVDLLPLWHQRERALGRRLTVKEVATATGLDWKTVSNLKANRTQRFDGAVIAPLCEYFGVPDGAPVPFLTVSYKRNGGGG
jgi:hypothetical protein